MLIRTRNPKIWDLADVRCDIGGEFIPKQLKFDHHHKDFNYVYAPKYHEIKLSTAGLVFNHFAKHMILHIASKWKVNLKKIQGSQVYINNDTECVSPHKSDQDPNSPKATSPDPKSPDLEEVKLDDWGLPILSEEEDL